MAKWPIFIYIYIYIYITHDISKSIYLLMKYLNFDQYFTAVCSHKDLIDKKSSLVHTKKLSVAQTQYQNRFHHYSDVIMRAMVSQISSVSMVCSTVCSGAAQKNIAPRHWPL